MKRVEHPLADEWLLESAAGTLPEGAEVLIAAHAEMCPEVADRLTAAEEIGAALKASEAAAQLSADLKARTLAGLEAAGSQDSGAQATDSGEAPDPALPRALATYFGAGLDDLNWSFLAPGLRKAQLWEGRAGERLILLRGRPGVGLPVHSHHGTELTLILSGAFSDHTGRYARGDVQEADPELTHEITIEDGAECICLAYTDRPLKMGGWIARALQPFLKI